MRKKLFLVDISVNFDMVVEAENEDEASTLAQENFYDELSNQSGPDITVLGEATKDNIPDDWMDSYPYSDDREASMTCKQILKKQEEEPVEPSNLDLFSNDKGQ